MGVQGLTYWSNQKPQKDRIYEKKDLSQFRGKRLLIDAAAFTYFIYEDVMGRKDLYYLGDYGPDFIAAVRYFTLTFFHANDIATMWIHDGGFNPSKASTQQSRRADRISPAVALNNRLFALLRNPPSQWCNSPPSFMDLLYIVTTELRENEAWLGDCTGIEQALFIELDRLAKEEGVQLEQMRTILEADAHIAYLCLHPPNNEEDGEEEEEEEEEGGGGGKGGGGRRGKNKVGEAERDFSSSSSPNSSSDRRRRRWTYDAILSNDSDFLVFDCPYIPLKSIDHRAGAPCPCLFVPKGRFSEVLYDLALNDLAPLVSIIGLKRTDILEGISLESFRAMLPDLATLLGNDYFSPTDPLTGQDRGFVKKPSVKIKGEINTVSLTCLVTDKVGCARFLLACACNGWVDAQRRLNIHHPQHHHQQQQRKRKEKKKDSSLPISSSPSIVASLLFPEAPKRCQEYLLARSQYNLSSDSPMAINQVPLPLIQSGLAAQYAAFQLHHHHANLLPFSSLEPSEEDEEEVEREDKKEKEKGHNLSPFASSFCQQQQFQRRKALTGLISLQQFGFPALNMKVQRRMFYELLIYRGLRTRGTKGQRQMLYELLFYRGSGGGAKEGKSGNEQEQIRLIKQAWESIEIIEETVRLHPNTKAVDPRQPFQLTSIRLLQDEEEKEGEAQHDWRLRQSSRLHRYVQEGPHFYLAPTSMRRSLLLQVLGYPENKGNKVIKQVRKQLHLLQNARELNDDTTSEKQEEGEGEEEEEGGEREGEHEIYLILLALRCLIVAYGEDGGVALFQSHQRNHLAYQALLHAAAYAIMSSCLFFFSPSSSAPIDFDPICRVLRPEYPEWLTSNGQVGEEREGEVGSVTASLLPDLRLRCMAFTMAYKACLQHVLDLNDIFGRIYAPKHQPMVLDLTHTDVQRFILPKHREEVKGLSSIAKALEAAVLVDIEEEIQVYHPHWKLRKERKEKVGVGEGGGGGEGGGERGGGRGREGAGGGEGGGGGRQDDASSSTVGGGRGDGGGVERRLPREDVTVITGSGTGKESSEGRVVGGSIGKESSEETLSKHEKREEQAEEEEDGFNSVGKGGKTKKKKEKRR